MWLTTKQLATRWGVSMRRVLQLASDRGIVGRKIGNARVWTESEADTMTPRSPGAAYHTRNLIIKQLGEEIEQIKSGTTPRVSDPD